MNLTEQIAKLDNDLRDLIRVWERFFAGDLRVPPQTEHDRFANRLRALSGQPRQRGADQFRIEQLQHRFMTYATNWERMLREREEGRGRFAGVGPGRGVPPPTNAPASRSVDSAGEESLYDRYVAAKQQQGEDVTVDRASFDAQLAAQRKKLAGRLGRDIEFDVLVEDGKIKLAARKSRQTSPQE